RIDGTRLEAIDLAHEAAKLAGEARGAEIGHHPQRAGHIVGPAHGLPVARHQEAAKRALVGTAVAATDAPAVREIEAAIAVAQQCARDAPVMAGLAQVDLAARHGVGTRAGAVAKHEPPALRRLAAEM